MKSYSLKYAEALQIQASFNEEYLGTKKNKLAIVTLKEEERFFFEASDKINNHINFFTSPSFKKIHLIWLDEALKGKKEEEKFRKFLKSSVHDNGQPILISACLTKNEIESKFPDLPIRAISAELFSIYSEEGERQPEIHVNLDSFFKAEQEIIFYTQELKKPTSEIQGKFKLMNY